jgi:transposase
MPAERYACEAIDLESVDARRRGGRLRRTASSAHVDRAPCSGRRAAARDDTTVPILAKGRSVALFYPSRDRTREHPNRHLASYAGILQFNAFDGYSRPLSSRRNSRASAYAHDEDGIGAVAA